MDFGKETGWCFLAGSSTSGNLLFLVLDLQLGSIIVIHKPTWLNEINSAHHNVPPMEIKCKAKYDSYFCQERLHWKAHSHPVVSLNPNCMRMPVFCLFRVCLVKRGEKGCFKEKTPPQSVPKLKAVQTQQYYRNNWI